MKKLLLFLLLLPALAHSQIIYTYQHWADGGQFDRRILIPQDTTDHRTHLVLMNGALLALGTDGFYHAVGSGAAQVQTDWEATTGLGVLLNKPNLSAVALSGAMVDISGNLDWARISGFSLGITRVRGPATLTDGVLDIPNYTTNIDDTAAALRTALLDTTAVLKALIAGAGGGTPANPTASIGFNLINGTASTYMRSDAAPKLDTVALNMHTQGYEDPRYLIQSDYTQATTTATDYIKNKPTLGTAAAKDVPASGNASSTQVVLGNDSRLSGGGITDTTALMRKKNNLADVTSADTARANIGALGSKKTLGVLYSKTSWTSVAADWAYTGASGDTSIVLGKIQLTNGNQTISSGVNSAFNKVLKLTAYGGTLLPYVEIGVKFHISSTLSSSTGGIAAGQISTSTLGSLSNMMGYYNTTTTGTQAGSLILGTANTSTATTPQSFAYNQNDELLIVTKRRYDKVDVYIKNLTTDSTSATSTFQWDGTNASAINAPNTGMFGIAYFGGTVTIDSVGVSSETPFRPNLYLGTDSKGFYTTPTDGSFGWWMQNLFPGTVIAAGPTDVSADLLKRTKEIYSVIQPKQAFLASFPRNDTAFGIARTTWAPNLITVDTMLTNRGIPTFWADALFENQVNQISTSVFMQNQFGSRCIRLLKLGNSSMVSGDNIHENQLGAKAAAMGVYYSKKLVHYEDVLNSLYKSDDRRDFFIDTLRAQMIHMDFGAYHAAALTLGDIGMKEGGALRWAFGSNAQQASIYQNTSNAALDFQNDIGGTQINNAPAFRFRGTSGNATGTVGNVMTVDEDGGIAAINPGIRPSIMAKWMAVRTYINHGFWGGDLSNTDSSFAGYVPFDSTGGSWLWNPRPVGTIKFYVSGGTHGGRAQAMLIYPSKKTEISDTLLTPKWPNKSSLAGTDSLDAIDASGIHYKIPVSLVGGSDVSKLDKIDSVGKKGYTPIGHLDHSLDSIMGIINSNSVKLIYGQNPATATGVSNTSSETSMITAGSGSGSLTIPSNGITTGKIYRYRIVGFYGTATIPGNLTIKLKIGGATVASTVITNLVGGLSGSSDGRFILEGNLTCLTNGASGTILSDGKLTYIQTSFNMVFMDNGGVTAGVNTTTSNVFDVSAQWATADPANAIISYSVTLESLN